MKLYETMEIDIEKIIHDAFENVFKNLNPEDLQKAIFWKIWNNNNFTTTNNFELFLKQCEQSYKKIQEALEKYENFEEVNNEDKIIFYS